MASTDLDGAPRSVVAVDASAGGVEALTRFAAGLPPDLSYAIATVLHMPANAHSVLAKIIDRDGPLPDDGVLGTAAIRARGGKRYSQVADEAERALTILGKRLSVAGSVAGEHGGG